MFFFLVGDNLEFRHQPKRKQYLGEDLKNLKLYTDLYDSVSLIIQAILHMALKIHSLVKSVFY